MRISHDQLDLLALCRVKGVDWNLLAREAQRPGGLGRLRAGEVTENTPAAREQAALLVAAEDDLDRHRQAVLAEVRRAEDVDARLLTVLDPQYPRTLRLIFNLPPFLFVQGAIREADLRSVAVVGTRRATDLGIRRAVSMARQLVAAGVTVVSGLARGIDTAAHTAALEADGRTLADRIAKAGAVVSQFWPSAHPATWTFPRRNVTMSGIAQGTVVIEASATSGAKMQARLALQHGKKLFLLRSLVDTYPWAAKYATQRGAYVVEDVAGVLRELADPAAIRDEDARRVQLGLGLG